MEVVEQTNLAIKQDLKRMADWAVMVDVELSVEQFEFHFKHLGRRIRLLEGKRYKDIQDEIEVLVEKLKQQEPTALERVELAEQLIALSHRISYS